MEQTSSVMAINNNGRASAMETDVLLVVNAAAPLKSSKLGIVLASITGGIGITISVLCLPFVSPGFRRICLPYVPATTNQVKNILQALSLKSRSGTLLDVGSGDGRIVIAAAKADFQADGVELNPWLVTYSNISAYRNGVSSKTSFFKKDLWKHHFNKYNNVVIFGVEEMMYELKEKFRAELGPNTAVVACRFPLPSCKPIYKIGEGVDTVWYYETPFVDVEDKAECD
ncbi:ATP synthase subunit C lysine N-methyltransferase [Phymastichus coffea]|uniref:ATP synthase subunit C lysine N-methyltransferase n=1 Tax=Phymastichus coffea TaxID=108790 RepID=UPI00273CBD59|nr:ATP synthase subunit C lysine N-methyltransferase [Phymastichus coffea]